MDGPTRQRGEMTAAEAFAIGAAVFGAGATEADTVLRRATTAKDAAARAGGGRALLFGPAVLFGPAD